MHCLRGLYVLNPNRVYSMLLCSILLYSILFYSILFITVIENKEMDKFSEIISTK